jgi:hypothetical protein
MVLDGLGRQEGDSGGVKGLKERYWMKFLKGMVTDRNTTHIRRTSFEFLHLIAPYQILLRCDKIKCDKEVL